MNKIKFSYTYTKFDNADIKQPVSLLEVFNSHVEHLSDNFLMYDTLYYAEDDFENYHLNSMPVLVLLFNDKKNSMIKRIIYLLLLEDGLPTKKHIIEVR
jgi:hypothetical protein